MISISNDGKRAAMFRPSPHPNDDEAKPDIVHSQPGRSLVGRCHIEFFGGIEEDRPNVGVVAGIDLNKELWHPITPAVNHTIQLTGLRVTPDGKYLSLIFNTGQVIIIDQNDQVVRAHVPTQQTSIVATELLGNARYLLTACPDGTVQLWYTDDNELIVVGRIPDSRPTDLIATIVDRTVEIAVATRDSGLVKCRLDLPKESN